MNTTTLTTSITIPKMDLSLLKDCKRIRDAALSIFFYLFTFAA